MSDPILAIAGSAIATALAVIGWFLKHMIEENERAHSNFTRKIDTITIDVGAIRGRSDELKVSMDSGFRMTNSFTKQHVKSLGDNIDKIAAKVEKADDRVSSALKGFDDRIINTEKSLIRVTDDIRHLNATIMKRRDGSNG